MTRTPWFPGSSTPVRDGIYEVRRSWFEDGEIHRLKWTEGKWNYCEPTGICFDGDPASMSRFDSWRGLTEKSA